MSKPSTSRASHTPGPWQVSQSVDIQNRETSKREVELFSDATVGARWFAYPSGDPAAVVTTWMGDVLATIVERRTAYRSNMGDRRQSFVARDFKGRTWKGCIFGTYVRMRLVFAAIAKATGGES